MISFAHDIIYDIIYTYDIISCTYDIIYDFKLYFFDDHNHTSYFIHQTNANEIIYDIICI